MSSRLVTIVGWCVLAGSIVVIQAVALTSGRAASIRRVRRALTRHAAVRAVLLAVWLFIGWHFLVRSSR